MNALPPNMRKTVISDFNRASILVLENNTRKHRETHKVKKEAKELVKIKANI